MSEQRRANIIRAYVDTSVFGGVFDVEFADHSRAFFERVLMGDVVVLMGRITEAELDAAPVHVQELAASIPRASVERVEQIEAAEKLGEAYLLAGVVGKRWRNDAMQVATATIARADVLVSWNFKHIVRFDRMRAFNRVNEELGYPQLSISSPAEVRYAGQDEGV